MFTLKNVHSSFEMIQKRCFLMEEEALYIDRERENQCEADDWKDVGKKEEESVRARERGREGGRGSFEGNDPTVPD